MSIFTRVIKFVSSLWQRRPGAINAIYPCQWIQPISTDADEKLDRKLFSHVMQRFVRIFGCFTSDCKVKIAHLIFIWKIPYTWRKTLSLKCQGTPIAFYCMLNKSLLTSPIYGYRCSILFHQGPSLQGRFLDSTHSDSYSSFHFFFGRKQKRKIAMNERGKFAIYDIVI